MDYWFIPRGKYLQGRKKNVENSDNLWGISFHHLLLLLLSFTYKEGHDPQVLVDTRAHTPPQPELPWGHIQTFGAAGEQVQSGAKRPAAGKRVAGVEIEDVWLPGESE